MLKIFKKNHLLMTAKLLLAASIIWFLTHTSQLKFSLLVNFIHQPLLFATLIVLLMMMVLLCAWRWYTLNDSQNIKLTLRETFSITYLGAGFNNLLPSAIGGDIVRLYYVYKKIPQKKSVATLTLLLDRIIGFLAIPILIALVALFHIDVYWQQPKLFYLFLLCTLSCVGILVAFLSLIIVARKFNLNGWLRNYLPRTRIFELFISFLENLHAYHIGLRLIVKCLAISVFVQVCALCAIILVASILKLPNINVSDYVIAIGITQIINLIPVTPGGIGVGEMAFANILLLLNPGTSAPYAMVFLTYRLITMLCYLPAVLLHIPKVLLLKRVSLVDES